MKNILISLLLFIGVYYSVFSQAADTSASFMRGQALNVYLDCAYCDLDYFKTNFTTVNYVIERRDADVYILVTAMENGGGGTEYSMLLRGLKRYRAIIDTVVFNLEANATSEVTRDAILRHAQLGLVPYLMKTPAREFLYLSIDEGKGGFGPTFEEDKWNNWMFMIGGYGSLYNEKSSKSYGFSGDFYISKVTPEIKVESNTSFNFNESRMDLYEGDSIIFTSFLSQRSFRSSYLLVKSLGDHWGLGGMALYKKSEYLNLNNQIKAGPAVEYNVFKYADATRKQFRFLYRLAWEYSEYIDLTVHNKMDEHRFTQDLGIIFMYKDLWGEVNIDVWGNSYLNDLSQYSVGASAMADISIGKGLYINLSGGFSYVQDQIGLKKETSSAEDFLLGKYQVERDYNYTFSIGITFRFGSIFNNTVNPRFTGR